MHCKAPETASKICCRLPNALFPTRRNILVCCIDPSYCLGLRIRCFLAPLHPSNNTVFFFIYVKGTYVTTSIQAQFRETVWSLRHLSRGCASLCYFWLLLRLDFSEFPVKMLITEQKARLSTRTDTGLSALISITYLSNLYTVIFVSFDAKHIYIYIYTTSYRDSRSRNDQQYALVVPLLYSINWLLHVSAIVRHRQRAS
jgi:hypothetical protein